MDKRIQAALGLMLLCAAAFAQDDYWPKEPGLSPRPGDDIELTGTIDGSEVSITVGQMREALWFREAYLEARPAIFSRDAIIEQRDDQLEYVTGLYEEERQKKRMWRNVAIGSGGALVLGVATVVLIGSIQ